MRNDEHSADSILQLDPIFIPRLVSPVQTPDVHGGINHNMIHSHEQGLLVLVQAYPNMQEHDWIEVFWDDSDTPVASGMLGADDLGADFGLFIRASRVPEGIHELYCTVTHSGGGNGGESLPLKVLVRTEFPGGTDPEPDLDGHQNLLPPEPELPPSGIIDEEAAKDGVKVTLRGYPNMRVFDRITFSWGGELLQHEVTQAEVDAGALEILVDEAVILAAGASDKLVLVYQVRDEVHNLSSDWSMRTTVAVEIGEDLFDPPIIENPDPDAEPFEVIDLDDLGDDDLLVNVVVYNNGLLVGDEVTLTWTGTTAQGVPVTYTPEPQTVERPSQVLVPFLIPNGDVRILGGGRGVASYVVNRDGVAAGRSRRAFASFIGAEQRLPKPQVVDAIGGVLDPALAQTTVIVPGEALAAGDTVVLTWLGTRANGTPLLKEWRGGVSGGTAGKPMLFPVAGEFIAPLDGGSLSVYYRLIKLDGMELESDQESLRVGEARPELPAPTTRPAAENGILDPEQLPAQLQIVIPPWPGMSAGQTVYLLWRASNGPQHDDWMPISAPIEGHEVVFVMDREQVLENLDAAIQVSYRVDRSGEPSQVSDVTAFLLEAVQQPLPLPLIVEAVGDQLDPADVLEGATVQLAAEARFEEGDEVTVWLVSSVEGGSDTLLHVVSAAEAGQALELTIAHGVIDASSGTRVDLRYAVRRAAGGVPEQSGTVSYMIYTSIDAGALRVMGARYNPRYYLSGRSPRLLSALNEQTLAPMMVEWRYEDDPQWHVAARWIDDKPALRLYVRSASETWECRPANVFGNGGNHVSAFVAMRDEVMGADGPVVDMVAWGGKDVGGELDEQTGALTNVVEVVTAANGYTARLRDGSAYSWGNPSIIHRPPLVPGPFVELQGSWVSLLGRKTTGELYAWGATTGGVPVPPPYLEHRDYVALHSNAGVFAARRRSGHVVAWGSGHYGGVMRPGQAEVNDVVDLMGNGYAFVALRDGGGTRRLMAWGDDSRGADLPDEIARLTNVRCLLATTVYAFCIQLETGEIRAWPDRYADGQVPEQVASGIDVVEITSTASAFCARFSTGKVVAWGNADYGGKLTSEVIARTNIIQVTGSQWAFAALCSDSTVVAWGDARFGGDTSAVVQHLVNVRAIYGSDRSFTALTSDGHVVTWGQANSGGDSSAVQHLLDGKVTHSRKLSSGEAE